MSEALPLINIAVCSCKRPELLNTLLASLAEMERPEGTRLCISIVDNDSEASAKPVFEKWRKVFDRELCYRLERKRGIPCARNCAIDIAHGEGADYLVFVDDDEWVEPRWLVELYQYACQQKHAVIHGAVVPELPATAPAYMADIFVEKGRPTGTPLGTCATNNVLIPIFVTRELGLRFDESRPLAGGTDTIFFLAAAAQGVAIYECAEARVHEAIPSSRLTGRWLAKRKYRAGITLAHRKRSLGRSSFGLLASSVGQLVINALALVFARLSFRHASYYKALMKLARNAGVIGGLFGARTDSYSNVDGR